MAVQAFEGTWEELVAQHTKDLAGHTVWVTVLDQLTNGGDAAVSEEEFEAALDAFSEGTEHLPLLPPEANRREWIYRDHD